MNSFKIKIKEIPFMIASRRIQYLGIIFNKQYKTAL